MEEVPTYFAMDITDLFRTHVLHDSAATMCSGRGMRAAYYSMKFRIQINK